MPIQRTESTWPIVYERVIGRLSPDDTQEWLESLVGLAQRETPCALIVDFRAYETLSHEADPKGTQTKAEREARLQTMRKVLDEHRDLFRKRIKGVCYIVPAGPWRAILSGMLTALHPPYPTHIVGSMTEAEMYCQGKIRGSP